MSDANLNLIISVALMLIAVASVWKDVYSKRPPRNFFRRFTPIGRLLLLASFVFILINYFKDTNTERKISIAEIAKNKADSASAAIQKQLTHSQEKLRESQELLYNLQLSTSQTILKRVDSSYTKSLKASNEALAKYHIKMIDSLHTVVGTLKLNSVHPQLSIAPVEAHQPVFLSGADTLKVQFTAANSTCFNIQVDAYFFAETDKGGVIFLYEDTIMGNGAFINTGVTTTTGFPVRTDLLSRPKVMVVLYGSFSKDAIENDTIPYLQAFEFDFRDNKFLNRSQIDQGKFKAMMHLK